jgi:hypothetical protein
MGAVLTASSTFTTTMFPFSPTASFDEDKFVGSEARKAFNSVFHRGRTGCDTMGFGFGFLDGGLDG